MSIIVGWYRVNEETDGIDLVENVFADAEERTAFFENEIETGLVYDFAYSIEGSTPEECDAFAASQKALKEQLGVEYGTLFKENKS
jgi:hypothetical protein